MEEFRKEIVDVVALSVDPLDKAKETVDKLQLTFPVAYGLEVPRDADKLGAFWEERRKIIHATNLILDADKKVCDASYSIGPIGRITAADALSHIQFFKQRKAQQKQANWQPLIRRFDVFGTYLPGNTVHSPVTPRWNEDCRDYIDGI